MGFRDFCLAASVDLPAPAAHEKHHPEQDRQNSANQPHSARIHKTLSFFFLIVRTSHVINHGNQVAHQAGHYRADRHHEQGGQDAKEDRKDQLYRQLRGRSSAFCRAMVRR